MQTNLRPGASPGRYLKEAAMPTMNTEIEFRQGRLADEASRERSVEARDGGRQLLGHALVSLGNRIHGPEQRGVGQHAFHSH